MECLIRIKLLLTIRSNDPPGPFAADFAPFKRSIGAIFDLYPPAIGPSAKHYASGLFLTVPSGERGRRYNVAEGKARR
jgi:hypothetical protein